MGSGIISSHLSSCGISLNWISALVFPHRANRMSLSKRQEFMSSLKKFQGLFILPILKTKALVTVNKNLLGSDPYLLLALCAQTPWLRSCPYNTQTRGLCNDWPICLDCFCSHMFTVCTPSLPIGVGMYLNTLHMIMPILPEPIIHNNYS